jgi:hypothetical protein
MILQYKYLFFLLIRKSFVFSFIMEKLIPAQNLRETGMEENYSKLLNGDGNENASLGGEQTC